MFNRDSLTNLVAGLGTDKDKVWHGQFSYAPLSKAEIDYMYDGDWIAGAVVDAPVEDMTREWRSWQAGPRQVEALKQAEQNLRLREKVDTALKLARKYGGAGILIGDGNPDPMKPLDPERIGKGGIKYLHVLSRWELWAGELQRDPTKEHFGEPQYYGLATYNEEGPQVHPSRVVRFINQKRLELSTTIDGWGVSALQRVYDAIRNVASTAGNLAALSYEAKLDIIKVPGLTQNVVNPQYRQQLLTRFALANQTKSINNALVLDSEEEWQQKQAAFTQLPDSLKLFLEMVAGAADMPLTRLLGTSARGLNATGEGDLRNYYDFLASKQETDLRPAITPLDEVLIRHALGRRPPSLSYEWNPLWQLTAGEAAEIALKLAQATDLYGSLKLFPPTAFRKVIAARLEQDRTFPGLQVAIEEAANEEPAPLVEKPPAPAMPDPNNAARRRMPATKPQDRAAQDAAPRTLYVSRPVLNAQQLRTWAKRQGFDSTTDDMHVTLAYSREPVDWMLAGTDSERIVIPAGGPRLVEPLGAGGAVVLLFSSWELSWRWQQLRDLGASWDHEGFQPHVTITWQAPPDLDLSKVEPYAGPIVLGPERFAELDDNWQAKRTERRP